ncbi:DNA transfer protein, partial [Escherichia coli]|nr:DNA transfer protein [Escherichia coli]
AIGGAASGAMIGSAVPVIGTGIGALAGGVIGGLGSLF